MQVVLKALTTARVMSAMSCVAAASRPVEISSQQAIDDHVISISPRVSRRRSPPLIPRMRSFPTCVGVVGACMRVFVCREREQNRQLRVVIEKPKRGER